MEDILIKTKAWIQSFIIKLNLCPFAEYALNQNSIYFKVVSSSKHEDHLITFWDTIQFIQKSDQYNSAILILPYGLEKFDTYLDIYDKANWLLEDTRLDNNFQLASFHPNYLFDNENIASVSHYSNRSPYPIIHVLSVKEVTKAIATHGNTAQIPIDNINTLKALGLKGIKDLLNL